MRSGAEAGGHDPLCAVGIVEHLLQCFVPTRLDVVGAAIRVRARSIQVGRGFRRGDVIVPREQIAGVVLRVAARSRAGSRRSGRRSGDGPLGYDARGWAPLDEARREDLDALTKLPVEGA